MSLRRMEAKYPVVRESLFALDQNSLDEPVLNAAMRAQIGSRMRHLYDGLSEPLPERIQDLLTQLEAILDRAPEK